MAEEHAATGSDENVDSEVRQILVLPPNDDQLHDNAQDQLKYFAHVLSDKMNEYKEFLEHNSAVVFSVNYIQSRFIAAELCTQVAKLFDILNVKTVAEFKKAIEALRTDVGAAPDVDNYEDVVKQWDGFIQGIEKKVEEKVGPPTGTSVRGDQLPELGVESKAISQYVKGSAFDMVLVVVVRSFTSSEVTQHIVGLYNKMAEFHKLGCDVYLLTRGPPVGSRGGGYIKLIGVPFRKLYDENEALAELKAHRQNATDLVGWEALLQMVEASLSEEVRPPSGDKKGAETQAEDQTAFITQKGGTVLVDRRGTILYKYVEDGSSQWPKIEDIIDRVKQAGQPSPPKASITNTAKVDSEVTAKEADEKKKPCCVIL